jgi:hypothetical protein
VTNAAGATRWRFAGSPRPLPRAPLLFQWKLKLSAISIQPNARTPKARASGSVCFSFSAIYPNSYVRLRFGRALASAECA